MHGGQHSSAELTISVKVPCQECGGRGFVETVSEAGHVVEDTTKECLTCGGKGGALSHRTSTERPLQRSSRARSVWATGSDPRTRPVMSADHAAGSKWR